MKRVALTLGLTIVCGVLAGTVKTASPRFYRDDPIAREPESQDASRAKRFDLVEMYETGYGLFVQPGYKPSGLRAKNLNTIDEVPDSSWFTNRIGTRKLSIDEVVRGPAVGAPPDPSHWVILREKTQGAHPGVTAKDANGETWFLEFDPDYYAEGPTAAVVMATKFFWALGYNQVESFLTSFDPTRVTFDPDATIRRPNGKRTSFRRDDLDEILEHVARRPDGTYRVVAGRLLPGTILGSFRFEGTRPDDPNDLVAHEHRRELRALSVFGAWTNLTDLKAVNTIDTVVEENGRRVVKHWLQDVGSTFGTNNDLHEWDLGWDQFFQKDRTMQRLLSFGFALRPWQTVKYVEGPSIGHFEGDRFDPRTWRPQMLTTAFMESRADDQFWAARRVAAFSDEMIRAIVHTGEFTNPAAERAIAEIMIKRRDKIVSVYLPAVSPIVSPVLDAGGRLVFENAALMARVAERPTVYHAAWFEFDNATGQTRALGKTFSLTAELKAPGPLPAAIDSFVAVDISADASEHEGWRTPIRTYFRRAKSGWQLVGLDRLPDVLVETRASR